MNTVEYRFGRFRLQPAVRRLWRDDEAVTCPRRVFDLLLYLIEQRGRAVGRDELVSAVWGRVDVTDMQLGQIVLRARRAVDDDGTAQHSIATIAGFGYHWIVPTQAVAAAATTTEAVFDDPSDAPAGDEITEIPPREHGPSARVSLFVALAVMIAGAMVWRTVALRVTPARPPMQLAQLRTIGTSAALVLPLTASDRPDQAWVRLGGMDLIAERLRTGGVAVPTSESVLAVLRAAGDDADAQQDALQAAFGDLAVIAGDAAADRAGQWTFSLRTRAAAGVPLVTTASRADPIAAARAAADAMIAMLGGEPPSDPSGVLDAEEDWRRARAALLANETETARRILTGSSRLAHAPDELAVRLAQVDYREGKLADADAAMTALLARLAPGENDLLRARALIARGSTRSRLGDFRAAYADFDAAFAALPRDAPPIERARALSGRGSSGVPSHTFDTALADMGEARSLFAAAGDAFGTARVDANLGMLELYRSRPAAALPYLDAAATGLGALGAQHEWQIVLTAQIEAHLLLLQPAEAAAIAGRAWDERERSKDPEQRVDLALDRAHVQIATGRYRDAAALLADPANDAVQGTVLRARLASLRADLALRQRRWNDAAALARAALAAWPEQGGARDREAVVLIELRALVALRRMAAAREIVERLPAADALPADAVFRELGRAEWRAAQGDADGATDAFRDALAAAEAGGVPASIAAVAASAVPVQLERGRLDDARALAGRVAPWAPRDFDCALVQVRVLHAAGASDAWRAALDAARALAGEREIPAALTQPVDAR